jgi:plasmid replication initiation protein
MNNPKQDIVKSNALIEACYNPASVWQMRLLLAALMQIKSVDNLDHKHNFVVTANALADLTGSKAIANYRELRNAAKELSRMVITIRERPNGEIGAPDETDINVTSSCRYYESEGKVSIRFGAFVIPYISSLKNRFTKYQAKYVMPMKSSYGIRLYELCLQWLGEEREFSVEEFRKMFGLENKYKNVAELKRNVIEPALNDINTHSDIRVKFGQRKAGRRVSHFQFMIVKPTKKEKPLAIRDWITKNQKAKTGESWKQATLRLRNEYNQYKNG